MRRAAIGLACAVVVLASSACNSNQQQPAAIQTRQTEAAQLKTPQVTPTPAHTGTGSICDRVRPRLAGDWKSEEQPPNGYPLSDVCWLTDSANPANQFQISVAVLPVSAQDVAVLHRQDELQLEQGFVVKTVPGGIGQDSWSVTPAAVGPWLVFHSGRRLIRIAQTATDRGELAKIKAVARTIVALPGGIPAAAPILRRPECDRGTGVAIRLLGTKTIARRDSFDDGHATCRWGASHALVVTRAGGLASDAGLDFTYVKDGGTRTYSRAHRVAVGREGWQYDEGSFLAYKVSESLFVSASVRPNRTEQSMRVLALAKALLPTYSS